MQRKKILILFGGCSSEHEVSLQSAYSVLSQLDATRFEAVPVGITRTGKWLYLMDGWQAVQDGSWQIYGIPCTLDLSRDSRSLLLLDRTARRISLDAAFPILHGRNGEDGTVQGVCELAGLPLVGCGTLASALCMDKARAHCLAAAAGIRVPKGRRFTDADHPNQIAAYADELGYPLFVKPLRAGSSLGVTRVGDPAHLQNALDKALRQDTAFLVEEAIPGFEVGCAVLGNDTLTTGAIDEIELFGGFFNYEEKYTLKSARIYCPARIPNPIAAAVQTAAKTIYHALGCRGMARVDLFLTPENEIVFNEVNTIPGFTAHSRYPTMMYKIGLSFSELLTQLIELGVQP